MKRNQRFKSCMIKMNWIFEKTEDGRTKGLYPEPSEITSVFASISCVLLGFAKAASVSNELYDLICCS